MRLVPLRVRRGLRVRHGQHHQTVGFTLTELVISAALILTVVTMGGYGMSMMLRANRDQGVQSDRRAELNRAAELIASEVKQANGLLSDSERDDVSIDNIKTFQNVERHLALDMGSQSVVYFSADPNQSWLGGSDTQVLYRYGPAFNPDGSLDFDSMAISPIVDFLKDVDVSPNPDPGQIAKISLTGKLNQRSTYVKDIQAYVRSGN
ncbi:hypothetical protein GS597_02715 [Synechococcales cyanobacterium C]|uniref:Prepilin-type N-terminal cleavage/methylation domain-containing protein n=1 Tax=Petrachloros mirabilis ULC683 TaxID=2781853 RepID=A0A8K1ZWL4_9CYAN|nr:hypothetical protein [Petrachloros mirabilis]NCJ05442.1 hypothetical protein [Petrachloros mirabilis ULC683]